MVTGDGDSQCELHGTEVRDLPLSLEEGFEGLHLFMGRGRGENIVHMDGEDHGARGR